jgi:membrane protein
MIPKINVTTAFHILRDTFQGFIDNRALKLSASLPTIRFSPAPLLLLISLSVFLVVKRYKDRFFGEINGLIGNEAAAQIQEVIKTLHIWQNHFSIVGSVTLLIGTTVLAKSKILSILFRI